MMMSIIMLIAGLYNLCNSYSTTYDTLTIKPLIAFIAYSTILLIIGIKIGGLRDYTLS